MRWSVWDTYTIFTMYVIVKPKKNACFLISVQVCDSEFWSWSFLLVYSPVLISCTVIFVYFLGLDPVTCSSVDFALNDDEAMT
jgi:hypothetical protein